MFIDKLPGTNSALETRELINKLIAEILEEVLPGLIYEPGGDLNKIHAKAVVTIYKNELAKRCKSKKTEIRIPQVRLLQNTILEYLEENNMEDISALFDNVRNEIFELVEGAVYKVLKKFADDKK